MRSITKICMVCVIGLSLALAGCASGPEQSGFLGDYYANLGPGPKDGVKNRWLKPGVDFSKYNRLMIDSVVFYYAPDSEDMGIDGEQMKELTDAFNTELVTVLKDSYSIVAEPGPDAARLRIALTHIKKSKPVVSTVTSIIPVGIVISVIKRGTTGSWTGSGATSAEFILGSYIMNRRTFLTLLGVSWGMHRTGTLATLLATHSSNT